MIKINKTKIDKRRYDRSPGRRRGFALLVAAALSFVFCLSAVLAQDNAPPPSDSEAPLDEKATCMRCHGDADLITLSGEALAGMVRLPPGRSPRIRTAEEIPPLYLLDEDFAASSHGQMQCTDCHLGVERIPHDKRLYTRKCAECHEDEVKALAMGSHKAGITDGKKRPDCADCHGSPHKLKSLNPPRSYETALEVVGLCTKCHGNTDPEGDHHVKDYLDSTHGQGLFTSGLAVVPTCVECHGSHSVLPASDPKSTVHPHNAPATCGACHNGILGPYMKSVHGKNLLVEGQEGASCTSCHDTHGVASINDDFKLGLTRECSNCHAKLTSLYLKSYHGKANALGDASKAICSSCHGVHDILPANDPDSRVAPGHIKATCGGEGGSCHANVNDNFIKYISHDDYRDPSQNPVVFYTWAVMMVLLLGTLAAFIPHSMLWFQRTLLQRLINPIGHHLGDKRHEQRFVERFRPIHRFTHFLIIISFMGLVATGFPMKYSETGWAVRLTSLFGGVHTMGVIHRILAVVSFLYTGIHVTFLCYFFLKRCPRPIWKYLIGPNSLIMNFQDFKDFIAMMRWFFWIGPRPKLGRWTYFEKFDYFGEIWGMFVIGSTGLMLWMPHLFSRWLPGWVLNCATVVHSTEALLAASVIFLVHFFNTHLRPEKFPIDMVMLTGQMSEAEMIEERGREYDRLVAEGKLEERIVRPVKVHVRVLGAIAGIAAFLFGMFLIFLAITAEIHQYTGAQLSDYAERFLLLF